MGVMGVRGPMGCEGWWSAHLAARNERTKHASRLVMLRLLGRDDWNRLRALHSTHARTASLQVIQAKPCSLHKPLRSEARWVSTRHKAPRLWPSSQAKLSQAKALYLAGAPRKALEVKPSQVK
jgi:hypothetical protein